MSKRSKASAGSRLRAALWFAAFAVLLFVAAESWKLWSSDSGRVLLAARLNFGDPERVIQVVGREIRAGLIAAGVPADSIQENLGNGRIAVRWRVGLRPETSLLQTNYAVTRRVGGVGAEVLAARERPGPRGESMVVLTIGLPRRPLHEVTLVRAPRGAEDATPEPPRVALVLYGFGDDPGQAAAFFALPVPFAVAVVPGGPASARIFHAAHDRAREVVMHLPLEPINYPQVNPGPGTVLVTMNEARITGLLRRDFDQAGDVVAVANHMGSLATQDMAVMTAIYRELNRRRLPFLHVQPTAGAVCRSLTSSLGVVYAEPDLVLDAEPRAANSKRLDERWKAALKQAHARGRLMVWMRATPQLLAWLQRAATPKRLGGVNLVPLSAVIRRPVTL